MFLQIQGIKKSFGAGDSRVDVLKGGWILTLREGSFVCFWDRPVPVSPRF